MGELLTEANVAFVTGKAFGADDYIRISCTTFTEKITEVIEGIENFVRK